MTETLAGSRWLVLAILSGALLLITVDVTVLYTALPRLTADLSASASEKLWIVNAYPLVIAGLLPGLGTLGDRLEHKRLTAASGVIMSSAPTDRAGVAASIEELSFELGGAIGVAVLGIVLTAVYGGSLTLPEGLAVAPMAFDSLDEALVAAASLPETFSENLRQAAFAAFDRAVMAVIVVACIATCAAGAGVGWMTRTRGLRARL